MLSALQKACAERREVRRHDRAHNVAERCWSTLTDLGRPVRAPGADGEVQPAGGRKQSGNLREKPVYGVETSRTAMIEKRSIGPLRVGDRLDAFPSRCPTGLDDLEWRVVSQIDLPSAHDQVVTPTCEC